MQKISSIHKLILKIQQILGSQELNGFFTTPNSSMYKCQYRATFFLHFLDF